MSDPVESLRRCRVHRLMGVQIEGVGSYVPDNVVTNEDLARLGCDAQWIVKRTGIRERRHAPPGMATGEMAVHASRRAIESSGIDPSEIDLILLGTFTPDKLMPQTATFVQNELDLNCAAMDVAAACAGFMYVLITGCQFIATGAARRVLVVGSDTNSRVLDPDDKTTFPLFGDGAGAVVLGPGSDSQGMLAYTLGADGAGADLLMREMGGTLCPFDPAKASDATKKPWFMQMEGRLVFKWAVRMLEDTFNQVLDAAERDKAGIKLWLLHQANTRILNAAADSMGIDRERVANHLDRLGNTSAGSIPIALDESLQEGRIDQGDELVMCGFGAGLSWGTAIWKW